MKYGVNVDSILKTLNTRLVNKEKETYNLEDALLFIKQVGFDCVDFGFGDFASDMPEVEFYSRIKEIKKYLDSIGLTVSQTHGRVGYFKAPSTEWLIERAKKEIKATALLGCKYAVIHPLRTPLSNYDGDTENRKAQNLKFYNSLKPVLQECGVVLCIENLFADDEERKISCPNTCSRPEEILYYLDNLGTENFAVCFDVGHMLLTADLTGDTVCGAMIKLGKHIKVLHVHDNRKTKDDHYAPFMGVMDWKEFASTLKKIGYDGVMSFEIVPYRALPKPTIHSLTCYYKYIRAVGDIEKML